MTGRRDVVVVVGRRVYAEALARSLGTWFDVVPRSSQSVLAWEADLAALEPGAALVGVDALTVAQREQVVRTLSTHGWRAVVLTGREKDVPTVGPALKAGAVGIASTGLPLGAVANLLVEARTGRDLVGSRERAELVAQYEEMWRTAERSMERLRRLSPREAQILKLIARGERAQAIAANGGVSISTVRSQIRGILAKLEVSSQVQAVAVYSSATCLSTGGAGLWKGRCPDGVG